MALCFNNAPVFAASLLPVFACLLGFFVQASRGAGECLGCLVCLHEVAFVALATVRAVMHGPPAARAGWLYLGPRSNVLSND